MKAEIFSELETIRQRHGGVLKPSDVVHFARNPKTELHKQFSWDNDVAGHQYRLWQARQLIRVTVGIIPGTEIKSRIFVSMMADRSEEDGGYRAMADVLGDAEQRGLMLEEALAELDVFRRKYARLKELASVFEAIDVIVPRRKKQRA